MSSAIPPSAMPSASASSTLAAGGLEAELLDRQAGPHGTGKPGSTGPIRSSTTSVSARFRQIHITALGGVRARARPKHEDRQRAGILGIPQRRRGAEIGDAYLGASCAQEALADVRNGPDPVLPDSVRVDLDVEFDAGRPGIVGKRRERGFEKGSWDAGAWPTGLGGRGLGAGEELACQSQLAPIQLAIQCLRRWASGGLGWWGVGSIGWSPGFGSPLTW